MELINEIISLYQKGESIEKISSTAIKSKLI